MVVEAVYHYQTQEESFICFVLFFFSTERVFSVTSAQSSSGICGLPLKLYLP